VAGRELPPTSRFAHDDGAAEPLLADALTAYAAGTGSLRGVVAALGRARVLVPVVALEEDAPPAPHEAGVASSSVGHGPAAGHGAFTEARHAAAGVVAVAAPDGRTALPVFSSLTALAAWRSDARPMPAEGPRAAAAALQEGWGVLVLDPGPGAVVVPRPAVVALATGRPWRPAVSDGAVVDEVRDAVVRAVGGTMHVLTVDTVPGAHAEVAVVLGLRPGLSRPVLDAVLATVGERLATAADVVDLVDSVELRVSAGGAARRGR